MNEKKLIQENELLKQTLKECEEMCMTLLNYIQATNREIARIEKQKPIYEQYKSNSLKKGEYTNLINELHMHDLSVYINYEVINYNQGYIDKDYFSINTLLDFYISTCTNKIIVTVIPSIKKIYIVELLRDRRY